LQAGAKIIYAGICFANPNTSNMESNKSDKIMQEEDVSYYCENCKDETMFYSDLGFRISDFGFVVD